MNRETCFNCNNYLSRCDCDDTETFNTNYFTCPWCGDVHDPSHFSDPDSRFYEDGDFEIDCPSCEKPFSIDIYVSYSYTCHKVANNDE